MSIYLLISLLGITTQSWRLETYEDFIQGKPEGISITSDGFLKLSPELELLSEIPETYIFSITEDRKGNIYCGTGERGRVYKIDKKGKRSLFFDTKETGVLSLVVGRDGYIYCGTTPQGYIYKISPKGRGEIFFKTKEKYVWDLLFDSRGNLYAATGVEGKIYKVSPGGKGEVVYKSEDPHIMTLAYNKSLFCGTSGSGLVYRVTDNDVMSIYDTPQAEVHSIVLDKSNNLYLGCVPESTEAGVEVYRIDTSGILSWRQPLEDSLLLAMVMDERYGLVIGTGYKGRVYSFSSDNRPSLLLKLKEPEILSLYSNENLLLGTASPSKIYSVKRAYTKEGEYTSKVLDAGTIVKWGRIKAEMERPRGTKILLFTRSGNSEEPDRTWSRWREVERGMIKSPSARFLQWKAILSTRDSKKTPLLKSLNIWYLPTNLPPVIESVKVSKEGEISWESWDPNEDSLIFDLYFRGIGEKDWKVLKKGVEESPYTFNTQALPDGRYEIKLVASDRLSNPKGLALTSEKVTKPFIIDNTPPEIGRIGVKRIDTRRYRISLKVEDRLSIISSAFYSINAGDWHPLSPDDLIFDSLSEKFSFDIEVEPGEWVVVVRVEDEMGNGKTEKAIIRER